MKFDIDEAAMRRMWAKYLRPSPVYAKFKAKAEEQALERAFAPCVGCTSPNSCACLGDCSAEYVRKLKEAQAQARHRELCNEYVHGKRERTEEIAKQAGVPSWMVWWDLPKPVEHEAGKPIDFGHSPSDPGFTHEPKPAPIEPNVGGTCILKSGGPEMTIATVETTLRLDAVNDGNGKNRVTNLGCVWHGEGGELHAEKLSLMLVDVIS